MKHFIVGQKYNVTFKTGKRWGEIAGECEIVAVKEIPYNEIKWRETSVKDWFDANAGEITVILRTETNNEKPKTLQLNISKCSEELCREFNREKETYWFSPGKRNYRLIACRDLKNIKETG